MRGLEVFASQEIPEETRARAAALIALSGNAFSLWLAETERLIGYALVFWQPQLFADAPTAYLSELFVTPEARGRGAGTLLVEMVVGEARSRNCRRVQLLSMKNRASYQRGFYAKLGFLERPEAADFVLPLREF